MPSAFRITSIPDSEYRQFKFVVGSPAKEVAFKEASAALSAKYAHTNTYPSILAFHGSPARNWHNILRVGLNHNYIGNARAYGHGIYFAIDGQVSMGVYAQAAAFNRPNADFIFQSASALVEIVNAREECEFASRPASLLDLLSAPAHPSTDSVSAPSQLSARPLTSSWRTRPGASRDLSTATLPSSSFTVTDPGSDRLHQISSSRGIEPIARANSILRPFLPCEWRA